MQSSREGILKRIGRSVFGGPVVPRDDRERKWVVFNHWVLHARPVRVPLSTIRYTHTFGLGGMSLVLFLVLAATGVLLMFVYEPSPVSAHGSLQLFQRDVFFGTLIRNIHYWSANLLVVLLFLHLLRVYMTGGYYAPRQFNWVIGLALLCAVLISNFTGYLLPWDQLSYWAITIVTGMLGYVPLAGAALQDAVRGGVEVGSATLVGFYATHTTVMPLTIVALMGLHFWRIRKARGVVVPRRPDEAAGKPDTYVTTLPHLLLREFSVAMILIAFVMVVALFFDAPVGAAANPGMSPDPAKAPWYFVGAQELLLHFDPLFAVLVIPLGVAAFFLSIPYLPYDHDTSGILLMSSRGRRWGVIAISTAVVATTLLVVADEYWFDAVSWWPSIPASVSTGLIPTLLMAAVFFVCYQWMRRRLGASRNEAVQTLFLALLAAFVVLTVVGVWFRGSGMALVWPWQS